MYLYIYALYSLLGLSLAQIIYIYIYIYALYSLLGLSLAHIF